MYAISDEQIDYILRDLRARGIELEDLEQSLLDHICCILEHRLQPGDDFEAAYHEVVPQFYRIELKEIQTETHQLLTYKNYYAMRKLMIVSGAFCAMAFIVGSFFKVMHWPGAGPLLISAILVFSTVLLPLIFLLKTREAGTQRDKWVIGIATLVGMLYGLSTLFILHHWAGSHTLWLLTLGVSFFVLLPMYFFKGIRQPESRTNTIVFSIILLGVLGLQFTMTRIRQSPQTEGRVYTYIQSEQLLAKMQSQVSATHGTLSGEIQDICHRLKTLILTRETGLSSIPSDFETRNLAIKETNLSRGFFASGEPQMLLTQLREKVQQYNASKGNQSDAIPVKNTILDPVFLSRDFCGNLYVLNQLTQMQVFLATAENYHVAGR
jgi:hypothetical protein